MKTIAQLLDKHVTLTVESFDRLYLNDYLPKLQTSGQLVYFLAERRGAKIPSPTLLNGSVRTSRPGWSCTEP